MSGGDSGRGRVRLAAGRRAAIAGVKVLNTAFTFAVLVRRLPLAGTVL